jgi:D-lactate dehydrogenase
LKDVMMKIAFFSAHEFDITFFDRANLDFHHELFYHKERLHPKTAVMAEGCDAVCAFVNDSLDAPTLTALAAGGTRLILLRCAGFDRVDLAQAEQLELTVLRVPAYAPEAIAEHAVALMMSLNRNIHRAHDRVREGNFDLTGLVGFNMHGKTVGVVGTGKIGLALTRIMAGFGCNLLGYDVFHNPACEALGLKYVDLPELLRDSDIVSLHCPLIPETKHLINAEKLALIKPGAMLINTSRGGVVDAQAVVDALKSRKLAYYGMDVYEKEGALFGEDLSSTIITDDLFERLNTFPNVIITGHQSWLTDTALNEISHVTLSNAADFVAGKPKAENSVLQPRALAV